MTLRKVEKGRREKLRKIMRLVEMGNSSTKIAQYTGFSITTVRNAVSVYKVMKELLEHKTTTTTLLQLQEMRHQDELAELRNEITRIKKKYTRIKELM